MEDKKSHIISLENLTIGYRFQWGADHVLLHQLLLTVGRGELLAVIGNNGTGKSTLLKTLCALLKPLEGDILLYDKPLLQHKNTEIARRIGYVSTERIQAGHMRVFDLVATGRAPYTNWLGLFDRQDQEKIAEAIHWVGLNQFVFRTLDQLSDGEKQRAYLARCLAQDTDIILLDEPTAFLDLTHRYEIIHLLFRLTRENNKTVIFTTHDLNIAIQEADRIWLLSDKKIADGAPEDLILSKDLEKLVGQSGLDFDPVTGGFSIKRDLSATIHIKGNNETAIRWTRKALERLGFSVAPDGETELSICVHDSGQKYTWTLQKNKKIIELNSIYDLSLHLKKV